MKKGVKECQTSRKQLSTLEERGLCRLREGEEGE